MSKIKKHPLYRDKFRGFLVNKGLTTIILIFFAFLFLVAGIFALGAVVFTSADNAQFFAFYYEYLQSLLGNGGASALDKNNYLKATSIVSSVIHLFSVTVLLGAIVYKVTTPKKNLMIFRDKVELDKDNKTLTTSFYSSTPLSIYRLKTSCFIKYYEPYFADGTENMFPMNVFEVSNCNREMPTPYNYIPTGVVIPITMLDEPSAVSSDEPVTCLVNEEGNLEVFVFGKKVGVDDNAFCKLYIMVEGCTPQAPSNILEVHEYDLLRDVSTELSPPFKSRLDADTNEYKVKRWDNF